MTNTEASLTTANRKPFFWLPVLPVLFFFAHAVSQFTDLIFTQEVLILLLAYCLFAWLIYILLRFVFRLTFSIAICGATILMTGFLFFGTLQDKLVRIRSLHFLSNSLVLLFLLVAGTGILLFVAKRRRRNLYKTNRYLLLLFLLLIAYEIILSSFLFIRGKNAYKIADRMTVPVVLPEKDISQDAPDIHYILFDAYTNLPTLKTYWGFDNDIYPYLRSKGFYTIDSGHSNYISTPFSISSALNLQYLEGAEPYLHSNSSNFLIGRHSYVNNVFFRFLKKHGYDFSIFSQLEDQELLTTFGFLGVEKPVNWLRKLTLERIYLNPWIHEKIANMLKKGNKEPVMIRKSMESFRTYNDTAIKHLLGTCRKENYKAAVPVFSFTHLMLPHDPYQVDENGAFIPSAKPGGGSKEGYLQQLKYSNKLIRQVTDCLLADSSRKKIIIIQGDHGFRHDAGAPIERQYDALSAVYFFNQDYKDLDKTQSHINIFRIIINKFFGGQLPLLKDDLKKLKRY